MSGEHSFPRIELSGGDQALAASFRENADLGQALAASLRENADLGRELETAVQKAEKWRCDAEMRQGAFHRAMARILKKRCEVPPGETAENESLKSRSRRFARELFGRRSERQPTATGRRRGRSQGTPSHGRTPHPELPVRKEESLPDGRTCPDCGKAWISNGWKDTELVEVEVAAHVRRTEAAAPDLYLPTGKGGRRPGSDAAVPEHPEFPSGRTSWRRGTACTVRCVRSAVR